MRKLGVCQESHTHTQFLVRSMHTRLHADACEFTRGEAKRKSRAEPLLLSGRVVSQHNINPVKVKDKHPMFATTVQP